MFFLENPAQMDKLGNPESSFITVFGALLGLIQFESIRGTTFRHVFNKLILDIVSTRNTLS